MAREKIKISFKPAIIDASVVYKWFVGENYQKEALILREAIFESRSDYAIPDLLIYELSNALRYNTNYSGKDIKKAIHSLYDMGITIVAPLPTIHDGAVDIALNKKLTIYDAYYIALAKKMDYFFITADKKLYNKIKDLRFVILLANISKI